MPVNVQEAVKTFFSGENELKFEQIVNGTAPDGWPQDVQPWLDIIESGELQSPLVLPFLHSDGRAVWYAGASTSESGKRLAEELRAFVGASYTDFSLSSQIEPDLNDPSQNSFSKLCPSVVFRFSGSTDSSIPKARRALSIYSNVVKRYVQPNMDPIQNFGQLRAQFDRAILAEDETASRETYQKLIDTGRLSADNRLFLEVRLLAGLGRWRQIGLDNKIIRNVEDLRVPARVLADVIEALYRVHIDPHESEMSADELLDVFSKSDFSRHARLFSTRQGISKPVVVKAFLLHELSRTESSPDQVGSLTDALRKEEELEFLAKFRVLIDSILGTAESTDFEEQADISFENHEFDRAINYYLKSEPTLKRMRRLISSACLVDNFEIVKAVVHFLDQNHKVDFEDLSAGAKGSLDKLRKECSLTEEHSIEDDKKSPRDGWLEWSLWVSKEGAESEDALTVLQSEAIKWDTDTIIRDVEQVQELANTIGNAAGKSLEIFRDAYPFLFESFVLEETKYLKNIKPILTVLLTNTVLQESPTNDELELVRQIAICLLEAGLEKHEYSELLTDIGEIFSSQSSPAMLYWGVDIVEVFAEHLRPEPEALLRFFVGVLTQARSMVHRLNPAQLSGLSLLCKDFEYELPVDIEEKLSDESGVVESLREKLSDRKIGIYTLTETAGKRAVAILKSICPDVSVRLNSDKASSPELIALARNADIFVFAWKSSKHQAYYCVKDHRPDGLPLLQPLGKGSSSIVREVINFLEE